MARLSDIIERFIKEMLNESGNDQVQIQRNELADQFRCAPSQINYVLTTRFTSDKGYVIESRRGGGGHIVIRQLTYDGTEQRSRLIYDAIGSSITYHNALAIIENLYESNMLTNKEKELIKIAVNDRSLISVDNRNKVRADILKGMVMVILS